MFARSFTPRSKLVLFLAVSFAWVLSSSSALLFKKKYNPVLFLKTPPGLIPECDEMEKIIKEMEKELGVKVERLDAARDPYTAALLSLLNPGQNPPLLYHRESCQKVTLPERGRIRALIKGRFLKAYEVPSGKRGGKNPDALLVQENAALEQQELLEEQMLTPLQRKGKQAIRERTKEKGKSRAKEH